MLLYTPDQVTVISAPLITSSDGYNSRVRDWDNATQTVTEAIVQPVSSSELLESTGARDQVTTRYKVWLPAGTAISSADRLMWGEQLLVVDGDPQVWNDIFGNPDHVQVLVIISQG
jgi:hypothetical protein